MSRKKSKDPKFRYRYHVEHVCGEMENHLKKGDVILEDHYRGRTYSVYSPVLVDIPTGRVKGGYVAIYLSRVAR